MHLNPEGITSRQINEKPQELSERRAALVNRIGGMNNEQLLRTIADGLIITANKDSAELQKDLTQYASEQLTETTVSILENKIKVAIENFKISQ